MEITTFSALKCLISDNRMEIGKTGERVRALVDRSELEITHGVTPAPDAKLLGEAKANVMLAFRHLEDARMRLGKAIQAIDGGVSVYDRKG